MRQIGTLTGGDAARKLTDYLLTLKIETRLTPEGDAWAVWICDEDKVERARQELADFQKDPAHARYAEAVRAAQAIRAEAEQTEEEYERRQEALKAQMREPSDATPLTYALIVASVAVSVAAGTAFLFSSQDKPDLANRVLEAVLIEPVEPLQHPFGLHRVESVEAWRLVTPIFLHFGPWHLLFNMMMLHPLAGAVERARGRGKLLALVLVLAVGSNVAQYYFGGQVVWERFLPRMEIPSLLFGGMSGVLYGLFGYVWMKSRLAPDLGLFMHPNTVVLMIGWFLLCMTDAAPVRNVANVAHGAGLLLGLILGAGPHLLRGPRA